MANPSSLLSLSLCSLLFLSACLATPESWLFEKCQLDSINALEPDHCFKSEGGLIETWNASHPELQCAAVVAVVKTTINPRSLLLPYYTNYPQLHYIIQGEGFAGNVVPGCADETIVHFKKGEVIASPPGIPLWAYNDGKEQVVVITVGVTNSANQLLTSPKRFYLAGNPEINYKGSKGSNVFSGLDTQFLAQVLRVDEETVRKLQYENHKGQIMRIKGGININCIVSPPSGREHGEEQPRIESGVVEACTLKFHENIIANSSYTLYNPRAGSLFTVDSSNLPILQRFKLSAQHVVLYKNGIYSPYWEINGHRVMYVIEGQAKADVVDGRGNSVFKGEIKKGHLLVIPQYFVATKQAGNEGFETIEFTTNEKSMAFPIAGVNSVIRSISIPGDVLAQAFRLTPYAVSAIKYNQSQGILVSPVPN